MKFGVVVFPGSNCDQDCVHVLRDVVRQPVVTLWHQETSLRGVDAVVLPGGFSYGDYLRTGAIARLSPIMRAISAFANDGGLVIGICNGFQILLESGLLPGAMLRNTGLRFICRFVHVRVERTDTPFTNQLQQGQILRLPIAHNEGRYTTDEHIARTMTDQVVFRYCDADGQVVDAANPNGSIDAIAGLTTRAGNVMGIMPHPERASESALGSEDGRLIFASMLEAHAYA
ncbi:MAG: phosphoribosylformylglycinamidine synthase subunit PurQ [Candidatus Omnitrophica bacterium]|nr:phosphoribosylformylglycinamidine synthase subunit PurQ [Candidatus Omnitrophota bacterium]